jgi:hypothetical protein
MAVMNRRNAMIGYATMKLTKLAIRRKKPTLADTLRERWYLVAGGVLALTAVGGTLALRKRKGDDGEFVG